MKHRAGQPNSTLASFRLVFWKKIIYSLFLNPRELLPLAFSSWRQAIKTAVVTLFFCGLLLGAARSIEVFRIGTDWAAWFGSRLESITLTEDELQYHGINELPVTLWNDEYRVDFVAKDSNFNDFKENFREGRLGIWLSPAAVYFWRRDPRGNIGSLPVWNEGRILDTFHHSRIMPETLSIEAENLLSETRGFLVKFIIPSLIISSILRTFFVFFFYTFIFAVIPFILHSPMSNHGFAAIHAFYMYVGIPPLLIATLYTLLRLPWLEFNSLFVIAFLAYMVFVVWHTGPDWQNLTRQKDKSSESGKPKT